MYNDICCISRDDQPTGNGRSSTQQWSGNGACEVNQSARRSESKTNRSVCNTATNKNNLHAYGTLNNHKNKGVMNVNIDMNASSNVNVICLKRNTIEIDIANRTNIPCLVDSGSQICALQLNFFNTFPNKIKQMQQLSDIDQCTLANNQRIGIRHKIALNFTINNVSYNATFYILDQAHENIILGLDFLTTYLAQINLHNNTIVLCNVPNTNSNSSTNTNLLTALQDTNNTYCNSITSVNHLHTAKKQGDIENYNTNNTYVTNLQASAHNVKQSLQSVRHYTKADIEENLESLDLNRANLNIIQINTIKNMFRTHYRVLSSKPAQLGCIKSYIYDIDLPPGTPTIKMAPYRMDLDKKDELKIQLDKLLQAGIIEKSTSKWNFSAFLVDKNNTTEKRLVVNMKPLNKYIDVPVVCTPNFEDLIGLIGLSKPVIFSRCDIRMAFHQLPMTERAKNICSFSTYLGQYRYTRAPMGISDIPGFFNNVLNQLIGHIDGVFCYADDICFYSPTIEHHIKILTQVMEIFDKEGISISPKKTELFVDQIEFLGTIIDKNGIKINSHNLGRVLSFDKPGTTKQLKSFLGLASYLRRYLQGYAKISIILYDKVKGDKCVKLKWTDEMNNSFEAVRKLVQNAPPLGFVDINSSEPVTLVTDAAPSQGYSFYIYQNQKNSDTNKLEKIYLFFGGSNFNKSQSRWPAWRCELFAILRACKRLHSWLRAARKFEIHTDNSAACYLLTKDIKKPPPYLARWLLQIQTFNFDVKHIPGQSSEVYLSDFISRNINIETDPGENIEPVNDHLIASLKVPGIAQNMAERYHLDKISPELLKESQNKDEFYSSMKIFLTNNDLPKEKKIRDKIKQLHNQFMIVEGLLYHIVFLKNREICQQLCITDEYKFIIMTNLHDNLFLDAHQGIAKTLWRVKKDYWWPKMTSDITNFVLSCQTCLKANRNYNPKARMIERKVCSRPLERIYCDIVKISNPSNGKVAIFSIICDFTKYLWTRAISNLRASTIAQIIFEEIILKFSLPNGKSAIVMDNGPENISHITRSLCYLTGVKQCFITPYRSQSNAPVERSHQTILALLRRFAQQEQSWSKLLSYVTLAYNSTKNETTGYSPIELFFNISATDPLKYKLPKPELDTPHNQQAAYVMWRKRIREIRRIARTNALNSKRKQIKYYNLSAKEHKFKIGDTVLVNRPFIPVGADSKLSTKYDQKFKIISWIGPNNAKLRTMNGNILKRSMHVDRLKKVHMRNPCFKYGVHNRQIIKNTRNENNTHSKVTSTRTHKQISGIPDVSDTQIATTSTADKRTSRKNTLKRHSYTTPLIRKHRATADIPYQLRHRNICRSTVANAPHKVNKQGQSSNNSVQPVPRTELSKNRSDQDTPDVSNDARSINSSESDTYTIEKILAKRKKGNNFEYLCKWNDFDNSNNTWQTYESLNEKAKDFVNNNDIPFRHPPKKRNVNVQCISRCHKKFIENNNDYLSCFYETDIQIPLHYVVGVDQHIWNANSVYSILIFIVASWYDNYQLLASNREDFNVIIEHLFVTNNELYRHFLVMAIKFFMDKNEHCRIKLLNTRCTPIYANVNQLKSYVTFLEYVRDYYLTYKNLNEFDKHNMISYIWLHNDKYGKLTHPLFPNNSRRDIVHITRVKHLTCTEKQSALYDKVKGWVIQH